MIATHLAMTVRRSAVYSHLGGAAVRERAPACAEAMADFGLPPSAAG